MTDSEITARVEARESAKALLELAGYSSGGMSEDADHEFWIVIRDEALKHAPLPVVEPKRPQVKPMTDAECRAFEKCMMPFGKWSDNTIGIVFEHDPDYLHWLVAQKDDFREALNRYLMAVTRPEEEIK